MSVPIITVGQTWQHKEAWHRQLEIEYVDGFSVRAHRVGARIGSSLSLSRSILLRDYEVRNQSPVGPERAA